MLFLKIKKYISFIVKPLSRTAFLQQLKEDSKILDVGCGNNSPIRTKLILPNSEYTGIDIASYNQSSDFMNSVENYILTTSEKFCDSINNLPQKYDAVVSCHNLEHVEDRNGVLEAMCKKLKPNGFLYLSFPSMDSVNFPSREGTLNYFDDETHKNNPPDFHEVVKIIEANDLKIIKKTKRNKPLLMNIYGRLIEPFSILKNKVFQGTWEKWGFETIIIAKKIN